MPSPPPPTAAPVDPAITRRIRAGDEQAFARFYEAWFAPTLALARAVSRRDEAFALDVVQDVMLKVATRMPACDTAERLRAWMTRTVGNAVTDRVRSERRRQRRERAAAPAEQLDAEPWMALDDDERVRWLRDSLAELPPVDRQLLQARFGELTTVAAAASHLGITSDAAHGRLRRALDKLRQMAASLWHEEP